MSQSFMPALIRPTKDRADIFLSSVEKYMVELTPFILSRKFKQNLLSKLQGAIIDFH